MLSLFILKKRILMNELLGAVIVASSLEDINNSIKSLGLNDYNDLVGVLRRLDIEIAKAKDENRPFDEMKKLRDEYFELKVQYEAAFKEKERKDKKNTIIVLSITGAFLLVIILFAVLYTTLS